MSINHSAYGNTIITNSPEQIAWDFNFLIDFMPQLVWATEPEGYHDFFNQVFLTTVNLKL